MARLQSATQVGVGSTRWFKVNPHVTPFAATVQVGLGGGTANVSVEVTLDETDTVVAGAGYVAPVALPAPGSTALTADGLVVLTSPVSAVRLTVNSGSAAVLMRLLQAGIV